MARSQSLRREQDYWVDSMPWRRVYLKTSFNGFDIELDLDDGDVYSRIHDHSGIIGTTDRSLNSYDAIGNTAGLSITGSTTQERIITINAYRKACIYRGRTPNDWLRSVAINRCVISGGTTVYSSGLDFGNNSIFARLNVSDVVQSGDCDCVLKYSYKIFNLDNKNEIDYDGVVQSFDPFTGNIEFVNEIVLSRAVFQAGGTRNALFVIIAECGSACHEIRLGFNLSGSGGEIPNPPKFPPICTVPYEPDHRLVCQSEMNMINYIMSSCGCMELCVEDLYGYTRSIYVVPNRIGFKQEGHELSAVFQFVAPSPYWMGEEVTVISENELGNIELNLTDNQITAKTPLCLELSDISGSTSNFGRMEWQTTDALGNVSDYIISMADYELQIDETITFCTEPTCKNKQRLIIESSVNGNIIGEMDNLSELDAFVLRPADIIRIWFPTTNQATIKLKYRPRFLTVWG